MDLIPQHVFDLGEYIIPFTDMSKSTILNHSYEDDLHNKPTISSLPRQLFNSLYQFQKVGV